MRYLPLFALTGAVLLSSCYQHQPMQFGQVGQTGQPMQGEGLPMENPLTLTNKKLPGYVNPYEPNTHAHFAAMPEYPTTLRSWSDDALLAQLTKNNSKLIICLPQQRARVYVKGRVAMDWAVSTGADGHLTPTGVFYVMEKKQKHSSSRYGRFVGASGRVMDRDADLASGLPEGAEFRGASMPYWHRFTPDGVGLHSGRVVAGRRLSHGCIRTQSSIAKKFFDYSQVDMPVYITRAVEDYYAGGKVLPIDVKYRPIPNNDYTDNLPTAELPQGYIQQ